MSNLPFLLDFCAIVLLQIVSVFQYVLVQAFVLISGEKETLNHMGIFLP
jgi:hypothetical protein